jgi:hypothetical protein
MLVPCGPIGPPAPVNSGVRLFANGEIMYRKEIPLVFAAVLSAISLNASCAETSIPRTVAGDKGKYFLLETKKVGNTIQAVHKRVGPDSVGYTKTETNCSTMQMRELGYSEVSAQALKGSPTKWFDLVPGSSKSDLANFVCKRS